MIESAMKDSQSIQQLPTRVDDHHAVVRSKREEAKIQAAIEATRVDLQRLINEREQVAQEAAQRTVRSSLGGPVVDDLSGQLAALDVKRELVGRAAVILEGQLEVYQFLVESARQSARAELADATRALVRQVITDQRGLIEQLRSSQATLLQLNAQAHGQGLRLDLPDGCLRFDGFLRMWIEAAGTFRG